MPKAPDICSGLIFPTRQNYAENDKYTFYLLSAEQFGKEVAHGGEEILYAFTNLA